jgi:5-formyltetrahydrofolate cyclo-ligase
MSSPSLASRNDLRRELRTRRRMLSPHRQRQAARQLQRRLQQLPALQHARRIALYWPNDGEIDPRRFAAVAAPHQQLYLPVLQPFPVLTLRFVRWTPRQRLARNRFGIPEPRRGVCLPARAMDAILLPLVGFDDAGNRLGMGGGFYDRTLSFLQRTRRPTPLLIGLAHACQQVPRLDAADWDIPLHLIVTDTRLIRP